MGGEYDAMMMRDQQQADSTANWQLGASKHVPGVPHFKHPHALATTPFPAHLHHSGHFTVDRSRLTKVVSNMNADHGRLQQDGSTFASGAMGSDGTGDWDTASNFGSNAFNAYTAMTGYFDVLTSHYGESMSRLHKSIGHYADAESDTKASASGVARDAS